MEDEEIKVEEGRIVINAGNTDAGDAASPNQVRLADIVITSPTESISGLIVGLNAVSTNKVLMDYLSKVKGVQSYTE